MYNNGIYYYPCTKRKIIDFFSKKWSVKSSIKYWLYQQCKKDQLKEYLKNSGSSSNPDLVSHYFFHQVKLML